jgi:hypothetical protein
MIDTRHPDGLIDRRVYRVDHWTGEDTPTSRATKRLIGIADTLVDAQVLADGDAWRTGDEDQQLPVEDDYPQNYADLASRPGAGDRAIKSLVDWIHTETGEDRDVLLLEVEAAIYDIVVDRLPVD